MATNQYLPQISRGIRNHTGYLFSFMVSFHGNKEIFSFKKHNKGQGVIQSCLQINDTDIITSPTIFFREKAHPTVCPVMYKKSAALLHNNLGEGNHAHQSFLSVHVSLLDPRSYLTNSLAVPSPDLYHCPSCHPTPEQPQSTNLHGPKRWQPPLPSLPVVWVHIVAGASLPLCSQRHIAVCKLGAERPLALSHPADNPGIVPGPRTRVSHQVNIL